MKKYGIFDGVPLRLKVLELKLLLKTHMHCKVFLLFHAHAD